MVYRNNERGRSMGVGPMRSRPMEKRHDTSPYSGVPYLSPPPPDTWRRTNSDSALHQSANEACQSATTIPHRRGILAFILLFFSLLFRLELNTHTCGILTGAIFYRVFACRAREKVKYVVFRGTRWLSKKKNFMTISVTATVLADADCFPGVDSFKWKIADTSNCWNFVNELELCKNWSVKASVLIMLNFFQPPFFFSFFF